MSNQNTCIIVTERGFKTATVIESGKEYAITVCDVAPDLVCLTHLATGGRIGPPEKLTTRTRLKLAALELLDPWDMRTHSVGYAAAKAAIAGVSDVEVAA